MFGSEQNIVLCGLELLERYQLCDGPHLHPLKLYHNKTAPISACVCGMTANYAVVKTLRTQTE